MNPEHRSSGVAVQAIEATMRHFCPGGVVTAFRDVLDLTVDEWKALAFRRIAESGVVYRDNTGTDPYQNPHADDE